MHDHEKLVERAKELASKSTEFTKRRGPGTAGGNGFTAAFKTGLDTFATSTFGDRCHLEFLVHPTCAFAVDYYFPIDAVIIELGLSLQNSLSEFEKDLWKAALAKRAGHQVSKVVLLGKTGTRVRHSSPGSSAIMELLLKDFGIETIVHDLP